MTVNVQLVHRMLMTMSWKFAADTFINQFLQIINVGRLIYLIEGKLWIIIGSRISACVSCC